MPRVVPRTTQKPEPRSVMLSALVPVEQRRRLAERARTEDRSVSAVVRRAIDGYLATPLGSGVMNLEQLRVEAALLQEQAMAKGSS